MYFVRTYRIGAVRAGTAVVVLLLLTPHFNYPIHDLATNPPAHLFAYILSTRIVLVQSVLALPPWCFSC